MRLCAIKEGPAGTRGGEFINFEDLSSDAGWRYNAARGLVLIHTHCEADMRELNRRGAHRALILALVAVTLRSGRDAVESGEILMVLDCSVNFAESNL